jgi:hypothetical protein
MAEYAMTWGETPTSDDKLWALVAHVSVFASTFFGPLVVYLIFQDKSKFVKYHAMQALTFQGLVWLLTIVISVISTVTCGIGAFLYLFLLPLALVPIWGAYVSFSGQWGGFPGLSTFGK